MLSVADGRVLALAGRHRAAPATNDARLATSAWAPAASVFKLVTSAALLGEGVTPATRVCYHGGVHSVEADNLEDHPELDQPLQVARLRPGEVAERDPGAPGARLTSIR